MRQQTRQKDESHRHDLPKPYGVIGANNHYQLLSMSLMLGLLYCIGYITPIADQWGVITLYCAVWLGMGSVLFWYARQKRSTLILVHVRQSSRWKTWLRGGVIMFSLSMLFAAPIALSLLVSLSQGIGDIGWLGLVLCALVWALVGPRIDSGVHRVITPAADRYFSAKIVLSLATGLLVAALLAAKLWQPIPDLTNLSLTEAFRWGQAHTFARSPILHALTAFWAGLDGVRYWLAEQIAAGQPSIWIRFLFWGIALIEQVLFVIPALLLVQGASLVANRFGQPANRSSEGRQHSTGPGYAMTLIALLIPAVLLWHQLAPSPWGWFTEKTVLVKVRGQSYNLSAERFDRILETTVGYTANQSRADMARLDAATDRRIDKVFDAAIDRVDPTVDWYYSLKGKAVRTSAAVLAWFTDKSGRLVMKKLFPHGGVEQQLKQLNARYVSHYQEVQKGLLHRMTNQLLVLLAPYATKVDRDMQPQVVSLDFQTLYSSYLRDVLNNDASLKQLTISVTAGGAVVATRIIAKQVAKKAAIQAGERTVAASGARMLASGACVFTGPAVLVCAGATFLATTVITEVAFQQVDKAMHADEKRQHLTQRLNAMRRSVKKQYQKKLNRIRPRDWSDLKSRVDSQLRPIDTLALRLF